MSTTTHAIERLDSLVHFATGYAKGIGFDRQVFATAGHVKS